jgi:hypothetical protein
MTDKLPKNQKVRSPNYPAFPLDLCIERAQILFNRFAKTPFLFNTAIQALDYSPKGSPGKQALAALSYYGLVEINGVGEARRVKITDSAQKIILDKRPISPDRDLLIKEAALKPAFFKKIKDNYGNQLPDDSLLEYDLPIKFKFNPATIRNFISVFKKTMEFAKVYESDIMPDENTLGEETGMITQEEKLGTRGVPPPPPMRSPAPLATGNEREKALYSLGGDLKVRILFSGNSAISDKAIEKLMKLLEINKDDFIEEKVDDKEPS